MRTYDINFKQEAIKLAKEIGSTKAAKELNIPSRTMNTCISKAKTEKLTGKAPTPKNAMTPASYHEPYGCCALTPLYSGNSCGTILSECTHEQKKLMLFGQLPQNI